jgi:GntR family transcriptional regulator, transcriptional repressor for pyruvate dehydrogenase complex
MKLKPIQRSRLYESAVDQIRSLILADDYKPGDRLPSERELAEQLSVGRPSVREALRILGAMGLIEIRVGNGTYVRDVTLLPYIDSLITHISSRLKTQEGNLLKLWDVRKILEVGNVGLACSRITPGRLDKMAACVQEMEKNIRNRETFISTGVQFHREIAEATDNEILIMLWNNVWDLILRSDAYRRRSSPRFRLRHSPSQSLEDHRRIYRALIRRNQAESLMAMEEHLAKEEEAFREVLNGGGKRGKPPEGRNMGRGKPPLTLPSPARGRG